MGISVSAPQYAMGISGQRNGEADGEVRCRFTHSGANADTAGPVGINGEAYLLLAAGPTAGTGQ